MIAIMKSLVYRLLIPIAVLAILPLAAQDAVKKKPGDKAAAKDDKKSEEAGDKTGAREVTYLDIVHAKDKAMRLKDDNMRDIQMLNNLAAQLPEAVDKGDSDKIASEYKDGLKMIYRMEYVPAEKTLRENRDNIGKAMSKASEAFRKKTAEMLNQSADRMADLDMQAENSNSHDAIRMAGIVQKNQHRLAVGYQQLTLATTAEKHRRYAEALSHYRLARLHSIYLKIELAKDDAEKNKLRAEYRNELDEKYFPKEEKKEAAGLAPEKKPAATATAEKKPSGK